MLGMPGLPGAGSPEDMKSAAEFAQRMAVMMQDPAIQKSLKNPRVQAVMAEMMAGANLKDSAAQAPTDDEVLKKYKDDPEVMDFYSRLTQAMEGVLKTPYSCDKPAPAPAAQAAGAGAAPPKKQEKSSGGKVAEATAAQAKEGEPAGGGLAGMAGLDAEALGRLKGNTDLQAALQNPKMLEKMHALMQNPANVEATIAADPELAALEDKLMAALGAGGPAQSAPTGPSAGTGASPRKGGNGRAKAVPAKVLSSEERLKGSLAVMLRLKGAVEAHAAALAVLKEEDDLEDQDAKRRAADNALCKEVGGDLETLQGYLEDRKSVV